MTAWKSKSRVLPRPLKIPGIMDLVTLGGRADAARASAKETRAKCTWQHVETKLKQAAAGGDVTELWAALQMVLMMENIEYRLK
jgi:hypothetical protein